MTMWKRLTVGYIAAGLLCQLVHTPAAQGQQVQPATTPLLKPLALPHVYWHFLIYVNVLDQKASQMAAQGEDSDWLRNDLQTRLGFSDEDFAVVRTSSQRLASELATLNPLMNAVASTKLSPSEASQMTGLIAQREAYIQNEMSSMAQALSPQKRAALETFMTQFLAPKTIASQAAAAPANQ